MGNPRGHSTSSICCNNHDEIVAQILSASENTLWVSEHMAELRQKYLHKFIAVHNGNIVASSEDQARFFRIVRTKQSKNLPVMAIEFITGENEKWIL
jgi:ABC-type phosphate/phosphonate transport system ATPase subunit